MKKSLFLIPFILFSLNFNSCYKEQTPLPELKAGRFLNDFTYEVFLEEPYVATFSIWIPEGIEPRAILVLSAGGGGSALSMINLYEWQEYARSENLALVGTYILAPAEKGAYALNVALSNFSESTEIPQLKRRYLLLRGFSSGGRFSHDYASLYPEKTLAFANIKGIVDEKDYIIPPGLFIIGLNDLEVRNDAIKNAFLKQRSIDGISCLSVERQGYHDIGDNDVLVREFFSSILNKRLDLDGNIKVLQIEDMYLGNYDLIETHAFTDYPYDKEKASCLIDSGFSEKWLNFAQR